MTKTKTKTMTGKIRYKISPLVVNINDRHGLWVKELLVSTHKMFGSVELFCQTILTDCSPEL